MNKPRKKKAKPLTLEQILKRARQVLVKQSWTPDGHDLQGYPTPFLIRSAERAHFHTFNDKEYVDYYLSDGSLLAGHTPRQVVLALKKTAEQCLHTADLTRAEIELGFQIRSCLPGCQKIFFTNDEREALSRALSFAIDLTRRNVVFIVEGCSSWEPFYRTHRQGNMLTPKDIARSLAGQAENIIRMPLSQLGNINQLIEMYHNQIAAILIEPIGTHAGVVSLSKEMLKAVRALANQYGILLIFDESRTAFRHHARGGQDELGIEPDLTCLGGVLGGGFSLGAIGGQDMMMDRFAQKGYTERSLCARSQPVIMRTGLAALRMLNNDFYQGLHKKTRYFLSILEESIRLKDVPYTCRQYGSMFSLGLKTDESQPHTTLLPPMLYRELFDELLTLNIFINPIYYEPSYICAVHTKRQIEVLVEGLMTFFVNHKDPLAEGISI